MEERGSFRRGSFAGWTGFAGLVAVFLIGIGIAAEDKLVRIGEPDVGWRMAGPYLSPTRGDAAGAGLRWGGRALEINGVPVDPTYLRGDLPPSVRTGLGESNRLRFERPTGEVREIVIAVRVWRIADAWYTQGAIDMLGVLFAVLGIGTFLLRPFEPTSWALLSISTITGGLLPTLFVPAREGETLKLVYFATTAGMSCFLPFHGALAFPVVHPWVVRRAHVITLVYVLGVLNAGLQTAGLYAGGAGPLFYARTFGTGALLVGILTLAGRCAWLALPGREPVIAQRARILLAGTLLGFVPLGVVLFLQMGLDMFAIDLRIAWWMLGLFVLALVRITLRQELMNARIAVRRAVIYTGAVGVLTGIAVTLSLFSPWAVAMLLFPLLYLWPRFDARLEARLYPKRAHFPELARAISRELGMAPSAEGVLRVLAGAPERLVDARSAVAFMLPGIATDELQLVTRGDVDPEGGEPLTEEPLLQLLSATRKEVLRDTIALQPQYANIEAELTACLDRLGADAVLPIVDDDDRVRGGLAIGPRESGDPYEPFELDVLGAIVQQAYESIERVHAMERLSQRELDFADLKRFFPPQIIDQVLADGGASELRRRRRRVTIVFADLRGFTAFSDSVEPEEVTATLSEFHDAMGVHIATWAGTLERFTGDGFMVFFNDPLEQPDHVERAARMALAMRGAMGKLRETWLSKGYRIDTGIGIHTGYATCGFVGYEGRRDYGVIGRVTNLAARLSDAAPSGEILISGRVRAELPEAFVTEPEGELALKGFQQPQTAHRLVALHAAPRASG